MLTGGGDAPGLNAVIRAVVKAAANCNCEVIGLEDSFDGLIETNRSRRLVPKDVTGILRVGGTILGTTNRGNPFLYPIETTGGTKDYSARCVEMFHEMKLDALVVIGGDGTLAIAHEFSKLGVPARRRAQDDRQRHRRDHQHVRLRLRGELRHRGDRSPPRDGGSAPSRDRSSR